MRFIVMFVTAVCVLFLKSKSYPSMMNAIDQRFDQPSFDTYMYAKMESLLIKTLNSQDKSEELKFMEKLYNDDVNISVLTAQMEILQVLLKDGRRMVIISVLTTS